MRMFGKILGYGMLSSIFISINNKTFDWNLLIYQEMILVSILTGIIFGFTNSKHASLRG